MVPRKSAGPPRDQPRRQPQRQILRNRMLHTSTLNPSSSSPLDFQGTPGLDGVGRASRHATSDTRRLVSPAPQPTLPELMTGQMRSSRPGFFMALLAAPAVNPRGPSVKGSTRQMQKIMDSSRELRHGSRCRELQPQPLRLGCHVQKGSSVGRAVHLLSGGDHLAILDFFHDGAHLAAGHHGWRWQGLRGHREPQAEAPTKSATWPLAPLISPSVPYTRQDRLLPSLEGWEAKDEEY